MSRILVSALPAAGHVRPALPVVAALVADGHDVLFYTGADYRDLVVGTGATFAPIVRGQDYAGLSDPAEAFPGRADVKPGIKQLAFDMEHLFIAPIPDYVADLEELVAAFEPDVLVGDFGSLALTFVAERTGLPLAMFGVTALTVSSVDTAPFGTGLAPSAGPLGRVRNRLLNRLTRGVLLGRPQAAFNRVRQDAGFAPVPHLFLDHPVHAADIYLQSTVPSFEYPRSDLPASVRFVGAARQNGVDAWTPPAWWPDLTEGRRVVLVTQGTVATDPDDLIRPAVAGLADADVLVVVAAGIDPEEALPAATRPANVRVERFVPFVELLPYVDVMVTNGGYGGVSMSLTAGVPLVVAGKTEDKTEVSARVAWSGAGINLKTNRARPEAVRQAVETVLDRPEYRRRATALAADFAGHDSIAEQVDAVLGLVGSHRARVRLG